MGWGQRIAAGALLLLALIAAASFLARGSNTSGRSGAEAVATSSGGFTPQTYTSGSSSGTSASATPSPTDGLKTVGVNSLPPQGRVTISRIDAGGPFPYRKDGVIFSNLEKQLPAHPRGWYHEYTVPTPGSSDRGARRIVHGKDGTMYYTSDHYQTFKRVQR